MKDAAGNSHTVTLEYDLYELPTTQHKAGLAGLLLMIESMNARRMAPLPEVKDCTATSASISFTEESLQSLFDDLFDASWVEIESKSRWAGQKPKRIVEKQAEGQQKPDKRYVYDTVRPKGEFLKSLFPADNDGWLRLWQDMLWGTLRGRPTTREVYKERANKKRSSLAKNVWNGLTKSAEYRAKGRLLTEGIVSSVFLGAQDRNAENVPFQGTIEHNLLLHFWTVVSLIYVPRRFDKDGNVEDAGFVLVIPEPSHLQYMVQDARQLLRSLDMQITGYRPRASLISVPEEGGLEYLYHLARLRVSKLEIASSLVAVETYHLERRGNNIHMLSAERILLNERILRDYDSLRATSRNPVYKSQRIRNLLAGKPWYTGMGEVFGKYPCEFYIIRKGDERFNRIPFFGLDARNKFDAIRSELKSKEGGEQMNQEDHDDQLALHVYQLTREYINRRTEEKSGKKYEEFKKNKDKDGRVVYPSEYLQEREKVCRDAFLAMRGRRDQDFIAYFTGTICSVPQYLPEERYLTVSRALITEWEKVKTLTMLAVSACSRVG